MRGEADITGIPLANVGEVALDRGGSSHRGTHQMRAAAAALPALEVAVARRRAPLAFAEHVVIHAEAHRAARFAPFEAGVGEDPIEALALGVGLDLLRPGHHQRAHALVDVMPARHAGGGAQILEPRVGARADEDAIDRHAGDRGARRQSHVGEGALHGPGVAFGRRRRRIRDASGDGLDHVWTRAPRHERGERGDVDRDFGVEVRIAIAGERVPVRERRRSIRRPSARAAGLRGTQTSWHRAR